MSHTETESLTALRNRFQSHPCFLSGHWVPFRELTVHADDAGFRQGVTIVERLRTYSQRVFALDDHLDRWDHSASELGIEGLPDRAGTHALLSELLDRNDPLVHASGDVGITLFATPGPPSSHAPTFALHLNPLDHSKIARHRSQGQPLIVTSVMQPDSQSWPRTIKVRARIHYYLADRYARQQNSDSVGVLIDRDGSVTETSIANLAVVESGKIVSPPSNCVLGGITQGVVERLANRLSLEWSKHSVSVDRFLSADEVLLMGTDGGVWFASKVNGHAIGGGVAGPVVTALLREFDDYAGMPA